MTAKRTKKAQTPQLPPVVNWNLEQQVVLVYLSSLTNNNPAATIRTLAQQTLQQSRVREESPICQSSAPANVK